MRTRTFTLLSVLAIVVAACGGEDTTETTDATNTTVGQPEVEAVQLSYALEPGTSYEYEVDMVQTIEMTAEGDASALGGDEELPGEASIEVTGTTVFTHAVAEGPEPGTYELSITGDFSDMEFTGTIDGESVDSGDIPDLAEMEPVNTTILVDEQGNPITDESGDPSQDLFGNLGGLDMLDQFGSNGGVGQFIGPPFSEDEVTVGDTWSDTIEVPTMPGQDPVTTQIDSEVVGTDTVEDHEVFVIETTNSTSAIEIDLAEMLLGFITGFAPDDLSDEEQAEMDAIASQLRFAFSMDPQVHELTTWFDYESGLARRAEFTGQSHIVMDVNVPDEATGELSGLSLDMTLDQDVTYRLTGSSSA